MFASPSSALVAVKPLKVLVCHVSHADVFVGPQLCSKRTAGYAPAPHCVQVPTETAPNAVEKKPEPQLEQLLEPMPVPYEPAAQFTHVAMLEAPEEVE